MSMLDGKKIGRLLLEAGAIVVSILLAFALDAMWDERQLQRWEVTQLAALRDEMTENLASLDAIIAAHEKNTYSMNTMSGQLRAVATGNVVRVDNDVLVSLVSWRTSDISTSSLDALLASGRLGDISNAEIRKALASWPTLVLDAQEDEIIARDFVEKVIAAELAGQGIIAVAYSLRWTPADPVGQATRSGETEVTVIPQLEDFAMVRSVHSRMASGSLVGLQGHIREIIALLDAELAGKKGSEPNNGL